MININEVPTGLDSLIFERGRAPSRLIDSDLPPTCPKILCGRDFDGPVDIYYCGTLGFNNKEWHTLSFCYRSHDFITPSMLSILMMVYGDNGANIIDTENTLSWHQSPVGRAYARLRVEDDHYIFPTGTSFHPKALTIGITDLMPCFESFENASNHQERRNAMTPLLKRVHHFTPVPITKQIVLPEHKEDGIVSISLLERIRDERSG